MTRQFIGRVTRTLRRVHCVAVIANTEIRVGDELNFVHQGIDCGSYVVSSLQLLGKNIAKADPGQECSIELSIDIDSLPPKGALVFLRVESINLSKFQGVFC